MNDEELELSNEPVEQREVATNSLQVLQQDKAALEVLIETAKKYPRDLAAVVRNSTFVATIDVETAKSCIYTIVKGKTITGPSVNLARIIAQNFKNLRVENKVVGFDNSHVTCEATCYDLENNYAVRTQIKKSIIGNNGKFSEDLQTITGNAGNAIAFRNAVFAVIPKELVNKVYNAVKQKIVGKLDKPNQLAVEIAKVAKYLQQAYPSLKLTDEMIAKAVNKSTFAHLTSDDLLTLIGLDNAIKNNELSPEVAFGLEKYKPKGALIANINEEQQRLVTLIETAKDLKELDQYKKFLSTDDQRKAFDLKFKSLKNGGN